MKRLNVVVPDTLHRQLKLAAFSNDETISSLITRLVSEYLRPPLAKGTARLGVAGETAKPVDFPPQDSIAS